MLPLRSIRSGRHSRAQTKAVSRLLRVARLQVSSLIEMVGPTPWPPALATRMSTGRSSRAFRPAPRAPPCGSAASPCTTSPPMSPGHGLQRLPPPAHQHHLGAVGRHAPGDRRADAGAAAGDESRLSRKSHGSIPIDASDWQRAAMRRSSTGLCDAAGRCSSCPSGNFVLTETRTRASCGLKPADALHNPRSSVHQQSRRMA